MTTSVSPSARVQVIPSPVVSPGNCGLCGKSAHPVGFADPRLDFEFYGTLYFCADCVGDFARAFGFIDEPQYSSLLATIADLTDKLAHYKQKVTLAESILGEQYHSPIVTSIAPSVVDAGESSVPAQPESTTDERVSVVVKPKAVRGESAALKLVSEQESVRVSSDSGNDGSTDPLGL